MHAQVDTSLPHVHAQVDTSLPHVHAQVDIWVMLADPLGYVLDSKPYLAPILTPYEALLALTVGFNCTRMLVLMTVCCLAFLGVLGLAVCCVLLWAGIVIENALWIRP